MTNPPEHMRHRFHASIEKDEKLVYRRAEDDACAAQPAGSGKCLSATDAEAISIYGFTKEELADLAAESDRFADEAGGPSL